MLGNGAIVRILEVLADNYDRTVTRADISRITELPKSTVNRHMEKLLKERMVVDTGEKYRKAPLYQLNLENEIALSLAILQNDIIKKGLENEIHNRGELTLEEEFGKFPTVEIIPPKAEVKEAQHTWVKEYQPSHWTLADKFSNVDAGKKPCSTTAIHC